MRLIKLTENSIPTRRVWVNPKAILFLRGGTVTTDICMGAGIDLWVIETPVQIMDLINQIKAEATE